MLLWAGARVTSINQTKDASRRNRLLETIPGKQKEENASAWLGSYEELAVCALIKKKREFMLSRAEITFSLTLGETTKKIYVGSNFFVPSISNL